MSFKRLLYMFSMVLILVAVIGRVGLVVNAESVTSKGTVKISSLEVKEKPSPKSKKIGALKKGTIIDVYGSKPGGWSEIRYNKKVSFVATSGLKLTTPDTSVKWGGDYSFDKSSDGSYYSGSIKITKQTKTNFYFDLEVGSSYQDTSHFNGMVGGYANYKGDKATVNIKGEYNELCKMTIQKTKTGVIVIEDPLVEYGGCSDFRGVNITFDGAYKK